MTTEASKSEFYDAQYGGFATDLYASIRRETWGEDIGQNSWITADEVRGFLSWIGLGAGQALLDIACGSGGPALFMAKETGCDLVGVDIHADGVAQANRQAKERSLDERCRFQTVDAGAGLPFEDGTFDALSCFDAINHLPDRPAVLREWKRVLKPGGCLLFTDPIIVTGPITDEEMRIRTSIGYFLMVPRAYDAGLLGEIGFEIEREEDVTGNMALVASRFRDARAAHADGLREVEGADSFERQQVFLDVTARLAGEGRLSRVVFVART